MRSIIDVAEGSKLARLAQDAAVIANVNSSEAFERLVFTITSGNVRMARTLGLQVSFQQAYEDLADELDITTEALTQQQKVQARTTAVLAAGATITGTYAEAMTTAGKKVLSLDRNLEESRRILGEAWLPVFGEAVDLVTNLLKAWQNLSDGTQEAISIFLGIAAVIGVVGGAMLIATPQIIAFTGALAAAEIALLPLVATLGLVAVTIGVVVVAGVKLLSFMKDTEQGAKNTQSALDKFQQELIEGEGTYEDYAAEVDRVNKLIDDQGILGQALVKEQEKLSEEAFNLARAHAAAGEATGDLSQELTVVEQQAFAAAEAEAAAAAEAAELARSEELATANCALCRFPRHALCVPQ